MERKLHFLLALSTIILASGCVHSSSGPTDSSDSGLEDKLNPVSRDAGEVFDSLVEKRSNSEYVLFLGKSEGTWDTEYASIKKKIYHKNGKTKFVANIEDSDQGIKKAAYNVYETGNQLTCTGDYICNLGDLDFGKFPVDWIQQNRDGIELTLNGTKNISGRECQNFKMDVDPSLIDVKKGEVKSGKGEVCLDKEMGYPASFTLKAEIFQRSRGGYQKTLRHKEVNTLEKTDVYSETFLLPKEVRKVGISLNQTEDGRSWLNFEIEAFKNLSGVKFHYAYYSEIKECTTLLYDTECRNETVRNGTRTLDIGQLKAGEEKSYSYEDLNRKTPKGTWPEKDLEFGEAFVEVEGTNLTFENSVTDNSGFYLTETDSS